MVERWPVASGIAAILVIGTVGGCSRDDHEQGPIWERVGIVAASAPAEETIEVPPPPFTEDMFPCSECHNQDLPPKLERRELKMAHTEIRLEHDAEHRWCLDCHDVNDRDHLHTASGEKIPFAESYRLCGQCHGDKLRDWKAGVHGRRTGNWDGHKKYLLCVHCHNAHSPKFKPIAPMPPPPAPERSR